VVCREVYDKCDPGFSGRCTAPLLVDKTSKRAVCNDSGLLLDNLYAMAAQLPMHGNINLKPAELASEIDELNAFLYKSVNNAVYR
jgi:glutathionyl-hydroquinone reductase